MRGVSHIGNLFLLLRHEMTFASRLFECIDIKVVMGSPSA